MVPELGKKIQMNVQLYNNFGIGVLGIGFVLRHVDSLPLSKALLIMPLITHKKLLGHLSNKKTNIMNSEKIMIDKAPFFSNFNKRYYDTLCVSLNAIQFLDEIEHLTILNGKLQ